MNNKQIITIVVSVVFILFVHTHSSCELMQQLLTKLSDFVYKYSNKMYRDQTMINNRNVMKEMMTKVQKITLKDLLQMDLNQVNAMISYISSF